MKRQCGYCQGTGQIKVTGVYAETYAILRKLRRPVVAGRDAELFGCSPTALNNRLAWLESNGFAMSKRFGRERRYSV